MIFNSGQNMVNEYIENPKTKGSGIMCCIPQKGACPLKCPDCFFQSGRSYLEPIEERTPNMPSLKEVGSCVVRVNDGNDSTNDILDVIEDTKIYPRRFFNTSIPENLSDFPGPVVFTANPSLETDTEAWLLKDIPKNLMFVRLRTNTWNTDVVDKAVDYYTGKDIPVVLTFMAYYTETIPEQHKDNYTYRKRTTNFYYAIKTDAWEQIMAKYKYNRRVYSCGKIEGEKGSTGCRYCGNCLREFYATIIRMGIS
jgi:hypothetical protein